MAEPTRYTSVTALTGLLPKNLTWWAGNKVAECAFFQQDEWRGLPTRQERYEYVRRAHDRVKNTAADLGTEVHKFAEAHNLGKPMPKPPLEIRARMQAFTEFLSDWNPEIEAAEVKVYHRGDRDKEGFGCNYAGTLDVMAKIDGRRSIIDIKTGKSIWPEAGLQINLYAFADFLVADPNHPGAKQITPDRGRRWYEWHGPAEDEIPMPMIERGYVLHLTDDGYALHPVLISQEMYSMGLSLFRTLDWENDLKKHAVRPPIQREENA